MGTGWNKDKYAENVNKINNIKHKAPSFQYTLEAKSNSKCVNVRLLEGVMQLYPADMRGYSHNPVEFHI